MDHAAMAMTADAPSTATANRAAAAADSRHENRHRHSASGEMVKLEGKTIILAKTLRTGGEKHPISEEKQPNLKQNAKEHQDKSMVTRSGVLKASRRIQLSEDGRDNHLIVRIDMKDGNSCVADFGPNARLSELDLDKGETVWIKGRKTEVDGKKLIVAREVRVEGKEKTLNRQGSSNSNKKSASKHEMKSQDRSSASNY